MYIALRPMHIAGRDYRIDEEIPDEYITPRLEVTGFVKRIPSKTISAPILENDGSIAAVVLEPEDVKAALLFLQQTPANAAKSVPTITSPPLVEYLKRVDGRKAVQEAFNAPKDEGEAVQETLTPENGGGVNEGSTE
jgi:hypothetical protein